jgi:hypothetical protein
MSDTWQGETVRNDSKNIRRAGVLGLGRAWQGARFRLDYELLHPLRVARWCCLLDKRMGNHVSGNLATVELRLCSTRAIL